MGHMVICVLYGSITIFHIIS